MNTALNGKATDLYQRSVLPMEHVQQLAATMRQTRADTLNVNRVA